MDKYKQRHSIQNILPEHEEWLKKHQVNDNRTPELFEQYEEEKKKSVRRILRGSMLSSSIRFTSKNPGQKN